MFVCSFIINRKTLYYRKLKKGKMLHAGMIYCFFEAKYEIITSQQDWFIDILISKLISTNFSQYREPLMCNRFSEFDFFV